MPEKNSALTGEFFSSLRRAFENQYQAVQRLRASGKKLIWMLGDDVPEEIILAAGMIPLRMFGYYGDRPNADKYLELSFGALWRGYFETMTNGIYDGLIDGIVMSNSSDLIHKLYYYMLQLGKIEPERSIPPICFVDYSLMVRNYRAQERNVRETRDFIKKMERWSGHGTGQRELEHAVRLCNAHRKAVRGVMDLRRSNKLRASEALTAVAGSFFLEKEEAIRLLCGFAGESAKQPDTGLKTAAYTGSAQETPELFSIFERAGVNIVADDLLIGERYCDKDVEAVGDLSTAITMRYHLRSPSSERGSVEQRSEYIPRLVSESGAHGLIIFMNHNDESYIWDLPAQKKSLDEMGIPSLTIEDQYYPLRNPAELERRIHDFALNVKGGD